MIRSIRNPTGNLLSPPSKSKSPPSAEHVWLVLLRSVLSSSSRVHWSVCQCYLIWQIESLEKHSCQLFADNLSIKVHREGHWYTAPGKLYQIWGLASEVWSVTWTSCMSSCLSNRIILTWKDFMVVQQPILKHSTTCSMEPQNMGLTRRGHSVTVSHQSHH